MADEDRAPSQDIELAGAPEPLVNVVIEDEAQLILEGARNLREAEITELLMQPRRPYPPFAVMWHRS